MTMPTFTHGSKATLKMGTAATPTVLFEVSNYFNSISFPQNRDTAETTTFGTGTKRYIPGLRDATFSAEGKAHIVIDDILNDLMDNPSPVDFEYCPSGGVTGTRRYTGKFFPTSFEATSETGDANSFTSEFQISGDVARDTIP